MKQIITGLILLFSLLLTISCTSRESVVQQIIGKWKMEKVIEQSEDVTQNHNPRNDRWISFYEQSGIDNGGTFESGSGDKTENSGKWFYYEKENELYLDSDAGEADDSYWAITIKNDSMHWKGRRFEFNKRFEIFHSRIK
jgi:hypothetical protein